MARIAAVGAEVAERLASGTRHVYAAVPPPARRRGGAAGSAFLGVQGDPHTDGAHLVAVVPGSAADRAGLREGDVVIRLAGRALTSFEDLRAALRTRQAGERVDVVFVRNGERRSVTATLDAAP
jgi:putative serine protease PepD